MLPFATDIRTPHNVPLIGVFVPGFDKEECHTPPVAYHPEILTGISTEGERL